jgi:hypothetical protein
MTWVAGGELKKRQSIVGGVARAGVDQVNCNLAGVVDAGALLQEGGGVRQANKASQHAH